MALEGVAVFFVACARAVPDTGFSQHGAVCSACPVGTTCAAGTTLATLQLNAGYWRSGAHSFLISKRSKLNVRDDELNSYIIASITKELFRTTLKMLPPHLLLSGPWSTDVRVCAFAEESCPSHADDSCPGEKPSSSSSYCACGYIGPLCSQCARTHFADWARGVCADCDEAESHAPFIGLVVGLVTCAIAIAAVLYSKRESIQQSACFKSTEQLIWVGSVKASLLFFMA